MKRTSFNSRGNMSRSSGFSSNTGLSISKGNSLQSRATKGSTRRTGDDMEDQIMVDMEAAGLDFKKTKNSGATNMDGDMKGHGIMVECKYKTVTSHAVRQDEWEALLKKAKRDHLMPALITENQEHTRVVHIKYDDFLTLIAERDLGRNEEVC